MGCGQHAGINKNVNIQEQTIEKNKYTYLNSKLSILTSHPQIFEAIKAMNSSQLESEISKLFDQYSPIFESSLISKSLLQQVVITYLTSEFIKEQFGLQDYDIEVYWEEVLNLEFCKELNSYNMKYVYSTIKRNIVAMQKGLTIRLSHELANLLKPISYNDVFSVLKYNQTLDINLLNIEFADDTTELAAQSLSEYLCFNTNLRTLILSIPIKDSDVTIDKVVKSNFVKGFTLGLHCQYSLRVLVINSYLYSSMSSSPKKRPSQSFAFEEGDEWCDLTNALLSTSIECLIINRVVFSNSIWQAVAKFISSSTSLKFVFINSKIETKDFDELFSAFMASKKVLCLLLGGCFIESKDITRYFDILHDKRNNFLFKYFDYIKSEISL